jgi:hypothetical protein
LGLGQEQAADISNWHRGKAASKELKQEQISTTWGDKRRRSKVKLSKQE